MKIFNSPEYFDVYKYLPSTGQKSLLKEDKMLDSKKYIISTSATSISISWEENSVPRTDTTYIIKYRKTSIDDFTSKTTKKCFEILDELKNDAEYHVNVYWENADGDNTLLFKEKCKTKRSDTDYLRHQNTSVDKSREDQPVLYQFLPVNKRGEERNWMKTDYTHNGGLRVCDMIAEYNPGIHTAKEKTVLLLGATGTGKSTLIDALINHIAGVSYNDDYRFSLIWKTDEERKQSETPGESQTSTVTVYRIPKLKGSKVNCKVNIIDTIGFQDTRKDFDKKLTNQLQYLFSEVIEHIDAVLIVIPLSTQRLTEGQEYIFSSIAKLFGDDIKDNICVAITHDDEGKPTCLGLLEKVIPQIPQSKVFRFNNSFVIDKEKMNSKTTGHEDKWRQRSITFSELFNKMNELPKTTVKSSHDVMVARHSLQIQLEALENSIVEQAQLIVNYKLEKEFEEEYKHSPGQTFRKTVMVYPRQYTGRTSINCRICKATCHEGCWVPFDKLNWTCEAIVSDKCKVCKNKCSVKDHVREKYKYDLSTEEHELAIAEFEKSFDIPFSTFLKTVNKVKMLIEELESKALRPDVLSTEAYIQHIMRENNEKKLDGYKSRGELLAKVKNHIEKGRSIKDLKLKYLID